VRRHKAKESEKTIIEEKTKERRKQIDTEREIEVKGKEARRAPKTKLGKHFGKAQESKLTRKKEEM
jgi:hypothetical protein